MRMESAGKSLSMHSGELKDAPLVVLNTFQEEGEKVYKAIKVTCDQDFSLLCVSGLDWNRELSPWQSPSLSDDETPFSGGADEYLDSLTGRIIPDAIEKVGIDPAYISLAGYSLAGLFAVYSLYRTDMFSRVASASGSFWFPGFVDLVREREPLHMPDRIYFSLGDKEARTRNQILSTVEVGTRTVFGTFIEKGTDAVFEMNPGNHFRNPAERMARGISWMLD